MALVLISCAADDESGTPATSEGRDAEFCDLVAVMDAQDPAAFEATAGSLDYDEWTEAMSAQAPPELADSVEYLIEWGETVGAPATAPPPEFTEAMTSIGLWRQENCS
jgi:hypothetical protein